MANSWVLSSWVRLVLSSLFCHCRVQKFSQWFHFKGWVSSHMSSKQNYGKLFAGKIGMKYYPVIYGDIYHRPWIKDPGTWANQYCMGTMSCQGFVHVAYIMREFVVNLFLVDGGSSLCFWICSMVFVNIDFWLVSRDSLLRWTCNMSYGKLPTWSQQLNQTELQYVSLNLEANMFLWYFWVKTDLEHQLFVTGGSLGAGFLLQMWRQWRMRAQSKLFWQRSTTQKAR